MNKILIVDDEHDIRSLIGDILEDEGFAVHLAANADECLNFLNTEEPDLIILDIWLKDSRMDGIDILRIVKRDNSDVPVVIISGHGNIEIAVAAIKQGAYDFIEKPFNINQLMVVVGRAIENSKLRRENSQLKRKEQPLAKFLGSSTSYRALKSQVDKVSKSNGRVLLSGDSGTGKEVIARYIHSNSTRARAPFVSIACAGIAPDEMEEVLFGRETTERGVELGLLEQAHGGIVYFDEVADMPLGTQSKILRVLVDQHFVRAGGTDRVRVDLRVLSSTSRNLVTEIAAGRFRQELFDRLNVVPIYVPRLQDRRDDIPLLSRHFIEVFHNTQGFAQRILTEEAAAVLQTMTWPGNVRQLRNLIERILILSDTQGPITPAELPLQNSGNPDELAQTLTALTTTLTLRDARELFEKEYLLAQIKRFGGNISRTANFIGMERSALHRKLKSLGVNNLGKADDKSAAGKD